MELCGFGPIVSGIRTTQLIDRYSPNRVVLLGVAGALDTQHEVGSAMEFGEVICFGIGAGSGEGFLSASEMGWRQWSESPDISDVIPLDIIPLVSESNQLPGRLPLLTCCAASANEQDVQQRLKKHANAIAEDMEGFSVAAACRFAGVPVRIVRGISNRAGDRNKTNWRVGDAMASAEKTILEVLKS